MLHLSTKNLQRYELPPVEKGGSSPLVAVFKVATMTELAMVLRDIRETGARYVSGRELRQHQRAYLLTLDDDADRQRALHLLDAADRGVAPDPPATPEGTPKRRRPRSDAAAAAAAAEQAGKDADLLAMVRRAAREHSPAYRTALAEADLFARVSSLAYVRRLLRGLEGPEAEAMHFSAPHGLVDESTLKRMGFAAIELIGVAIAAAANVEETTAKN